MSSTIALPSLSTSEAAADAIYRAVLGIDTNDLKLFESAWINREDAVFEMNGNKMEGLDAIHEGMFSTVGPLDTTHFITNSRVDAKEGADTARMTTSALAQHYHAGEGFNPEAKRLLSGSLYTIDLLKDSSDGLWKMKTWSMRIVWAEGDMSVVTK